MAESTVDTPLVSRRKIIERPRLTRLLDESPARIKMLIAPAGYGKTTLARQWLSAESGRTARWIRCSRASSDIAFLVAEISDAARGTAQRGPQRTRAAISVKHFRDLVIELTSELAGWNSTTWLVLDDYHELMASSLAEDLVAEVTDRTNVNVLVASRRRPSWATARNLLYSHALEIGQGDLAMTRSEVEEFMQGDLEKGKPSPVGIETGWPAFVALAASAARLPSASGPTQSDIYDFLVREILQSADALTQTALREVALVPRDHVAVLGELYPAVAVRRITADALRAGILTASPSGEIELHPLMRRVLAKECLESGDDNLSDAVDRLWAVLLRAGKFDDLFDLIVVSRRAQLVSALLREALDPLLALGRTASLKRWIDFALSERVRSSAVAIAEARLAIVDGEFGRARVRALAAVEGSDATADDLGVAWTLAGQASHLQGDDVSAITCFQKAAIHAQSESLRRTARWGRFVASLDAENLEEVRLVLAEIAAEEAREPVMLVDRWNAQLFYEIRVSGLRSLKGARAATEVLHLVEDPVRRTGFRSIYTSALVFVTEYARARRSAELFLDDVRTSRVDFAVPYAYAGLAAAKLGLRDFDGANEAIRIATTEAERLGDDYAVANAQALAARISLAVGRHGDAYEQLMIDLDGVHTRGLIGEVLSCRALALACFGKREWEGPASEALAVTQNLETRVVTAGARAVYASVRNTKDLREAVTAAVDISASTGIWDGFVCAYRSHPELLNAIRGDDLRTRAVLKVMKRARDSAIASKLGLIRGESSKTPLSPREREIHGLLALDLTNKQIAQRLFISEATVKLHVHHILEKLEVRSRTAAAVRYVGETQN